MPVGKQFVVQYHWIEGQNKAIQRLSPTNRYYVSTKGGKLFKYDKKAHSYHDFFVGYTVSLLNKDLDWKDDINYPYYISEAKKIINLIKPFNKQLSLWEN